MNWVLRDQLLTLAAASSDADRHVAMLDPGDRDSPTVRAGLRDRGAAEGALVAEILDRDGWPGPEQVGNDGQLAFGTIVARATVAEADLIRCRDGMRAQVDGGRAERWQLALIEDRLAVAQDAGQPYGTIGADSGPHAPGIDERRRAAGLPSVADQQQLLEAGRSGCTRASRRRPPKWSWILTGLGVASLVLAAVLAAGSDDDATAQRTAVTSPSTDDTPTTAASARFEVGTTKVCELFSRPEAEALLGVTLGPATQDTVTSCQYGVPGGQGSVSLSLLPAEAGGAQLFAFGADGSSPVPGLGRQAYYSEDRAGPLMGVLTADGDSIQLSPRGAGIPPDLEGPMTEFLRTVVPRLA